MHFLQWKLLNFKSNFNEIHVVYSLGSNWQYDSIGSDNGLAPNRRQAIIWTNVGMLYWRIYASLGLNELMPRVLCTLCHHWLKWIMLTCLSGSHSNMDRATDRTQFFNEKWVKLSFYLNILSSFYRHHLFFFRYCFGDIWIQTICWNFYCPPLWMGHGPIQST